MKNCFHTVESLIDLKLVNENSITFSGKFHLGRLFPLKFHYLKLNTRFLLQIPLYGIRNTMEFDEFHYLEIKWKKSVFHYFPTKFPIFLHI